jgi:hypothetical protein
MCCSTENYEWVWAAPGRYEQGRTDLDESAVELFDVGNGENVTVEKIRDIKDGKINCDYILPMNPSLWRASIGGQRRHCTSKAWIRVELQEEIPPPAKKVKLLPPGPGQLGAGKVERWKEHHKAQDWKKSFKVAVFLAISFEGQVRYKQMENVSNPT